jgi:segregation and condensation protein B
MTTEKLYRIIEALLFASDNPLPLKKMKELLSERDLGDIKKAIKKLSDHYNKSGSALAVIEVAGGFRIVSRQEYASFIQSMYKGRMASRLTHRALETLAIIAYKQPITKQEMEAIRGVNVDGVVKTLLERDLVAIKGRQKAPGNPLLYGTSRKFLIYFGLKSLNDLPKLKEIDELLKEDNKFLESLDQVALEQLAPESLGIKNIKKQADPIDDSEPVEDKHQNDETK